MLLPMAVLILGLIAINQWRDSQTAAEIEGNRRRGADRDLPLDAYLDNGFDAWLKRSFALALWLASPFPSSCRTQKGPELG